MEKYIFLQSYKVVGTSPIISGTSTSCSKKTFIKGSAYYLTQTIGPASQGKVYIYLEGGCFYRIPESVVKLYVPNIAETSYLGEKQLEKQNDSVKTLLIVVSIFSVALVLFLFAKRKLMKSLQA